VRLFTIPAAAAAACTLLAVVPGCATPAAAPVPVEQTLEANLKDNQTTREQVLLRFGEPSAQFESQRILTYRVQVRPTGAWDVVRREIVVKEPRARDSWENATHSVVLVFENGRLARHSLVPVK
jgi:hypothetical protein